jgi:hypothetical protein
MAQVPGRQQQANGLHPEVEKFVLGVSEKYRNHDDIVAENTALRERSEVAEGMLAQTKDMLEKTTAQRDHYMRLSMEQSTRFSAAMDVLSGLMEQSTQEAGLPPAPQLEAAR